MMDEHTLTVLEFDKIRQLVRRYLSTPVGGPRVDDLRPVQNREELRLRQIRTREMRDLLGASPGLPLDGARDIRAALGIAYVDGSILESKSLMEIMTTCQASEKTRRTILGSHLRIPQLQDLAGVLEPLDKLQKAVFESIDRDGTIKDTASKTLEKLRKELSQLRTHIVQRVQILLRKQNVQEMLQENFYTLCDGRYVLPIQAQHKGKFRGIVHDRSDTGATVFIEPAEIIPMGNRLRELEVEERRECNRILRALTAKVRQSYAPLFSNLEILGDLDFLQAVARFAEAHQMVRPELTDKPTLRIRGARHPLLLAQMPFEKVAPLDLDLLTFEKSQACRIVVVTGPNTGGKTVVIKTVGLLVLMALSGLDVPAETGTTIPIFKSVFADIGDEQSLEQSLSTFSSHISQIIRILENADEGCLVLLDELGAGTDPIEGGALGIAILDDLRRRDVTTLVTTHLDDLKVYAHVTDGVENAAMQFDLETLQPTYKLTFGIAGESNALRIASRLGMPEAVVDRAVAELEGRESEESGVIYRRLISEVQIAHQDRQKASEERGQVARLAEEHRRSIQKLERERHDVLHRARVQATRLVEDAKKKIRQAEEEIALAKKRLAEQAREAQSVSHAKETLDDAARDIALEEEEPLLHEVKEQIDPEKLRPGDMVQVAGFTKPGKVLKVDLDRGEVLLALSSWEMTVSLEKLRNMAQSAVTAGGQGSRERAKKEEPSWTYQVRESPAVELDVRQLRVPEALRAMDRYLEDACLSGHEFVRIIHGFGTGNMMRAVHDALKHHRLVRTFRFGESGEGGAGATVVTFKEQ